MRTHELPRVDLGAYELLVERVEAHHARAADAAHVAEHRASALLVSEYPLLLLHVQLALRLKPHSEHERALEHATQSDETRGRGAGAAPGDAAPDACAESGLPPWPHERVPLSPVDAPARHSRRREVQELGDAIERMLGL
jgi:hypothetical protein